MNNDRVRRVAEQVSPPGARRADPPAARRPRAQRVLRDSASSQGLHRFLAADWCQCAPELDPRAKLRLRSLRQPERQARPVFSTSPSRQFLPGPESQRDPSTLQGIVKGAEWLCVQCTSVTSIPVRSRIASRMPSDRTKSIPIKSRDRIATRCLPSFSNQALAHTDHRARRCCAEWYRVSEPLPEGLSLVPPLPLVKLHSFASRASPISDGYYRPILCPLPRRCRGPLQHLPSCPQRRLANRLSQQLVCLTAIRSAPAYRFVTGNCRRCGPSPTA